MLSNLLKGYSNSRYFEQLIKNLDNNSVTIDCGANVGNITNIFAETGAMVFAFEPNPFAFNILSERFSENEKVIVFNKGVWDRNTIVKLYFHQHSDEDEVKWSTGSSILEYKGNVMKNKSIDIGVIDLVSFINEINKPISILKIDIEGAECEVLDALIRSNMYKKIKGIFVETHDHKIPELVEKTDRIRELIRKNKINNIHLDWV